MIEVMQKSAAGENKASQSPPAARNSISVAVAGLADPGAELTPAAIVLPDGGAVIVRLASNGDLHSLREMFRRSSPETIYQRFHSPFPRVPEWILEYLTGADHGGAEALVAAVANEIVGHAMWVGADSREAEVGLVVEDRWQHRGIGRLLLLNLAVEARERGVEVFTGVVLGENRRMLGLIKSVFAGARYEIKDGLFQVRVPLWALEPRYELTR